MRLFLTPLSSLLICAACSPDASRAPVVSSAEPAPIVSAPVVSSPPAPVLDLLAVQDALDAQVEGCGTALRAVGASDRDRYLWFDNIQTGVISVDGRKIKLRASPAQSTETTLTAAYSAEGIEVRQRLDRRQVPGEEVAEVSGELSVKTPQGETTIAVEGETGC